MSHRLMIFSVYYHSDGQLGNGCIGCLYWHRMTLLAVAHLAVSWFGWCT